MPALGAHTGRRPPGRGALGNPRGRFARLEVIPEARDEIDGPQSAQAGTNRRTVVRAERARSIVNRIHSPDLPFDRTINPYRGCEHGCIYCYARPSHAYLDLSPGLDFETRLTAKTNAADLLRRELGRRSYRCAPVALGANTDPYQPVERRLGITRGLLEVLDEHAHPVGITTKSDLVLRDLDLLRRLAGRRLARVMISINTLDRGLARRLEPRAASPERRLEALRGLSRAGVPAGVICAPVIPGLNDDQIEAVLTAARDAGARTAGFELLRLPYEVKELFAAWLEEHVPERSRHVLALIRETRGGALNQTAFGLRMRGTGPYAEMLRRRFLLARGRLGLDRDPCDLDTGAFRIPHPARAQLPLL